MTTRVASIGLKRVSAQAQGISDTPAFFLDDTGVETPLPRGDTVRSVMRLIRQSLQTAESGDKTTNIRTASGEAIKAVGALGGGSTAQDIVDAVNNVLTAGSASALPPEFSDDPVVGQATGKTTSAKFVSSINKKNILNDLTVLVQTGIYAIDNVGSTITDDLLRPVPTRSLRHQFRRLLSSFNSGARIQLNTIGGIITGAIATAAPISADDLVTALNAAITSSTSATSVAGLPGAADATSFLNQLAQTIVTTTDGTIAINDTGDALALAPKRSSILLQIKDLIQSNAADEFRLQTTSGIKWNKVASLSVVNIANIVAALTDPA